MAQKDSSHVCHNEWDSLREVIVGRAEHSYFPSEPRDHLEVIMPPEYMNEFRKDNPFPPEIVMKANQELDALASLLTNRGVKVHRPSLVDWGQAGGYTGAMPRDALLVVDDMIVESCFAWKCRRNEVRLAYSDILDGLEASGQYTVIRAPTVGEEDDVYADISEKNPWRINESRPAFDAADFIRCGDFLIGQRSHVTNARGVAYVQQVLADVGQRIVFPEIDCPSAMHIDATFMPLRDGLAIYNPVYTDIARLRRIQELRSWKLVPIGQEPASRAWPPLYMTSPEIRMNVLSLDENTVLVEEDDKEMVSLFKRLHLEVVTMPFKHVQCLGGSFHCATLDLRRGP